MLEVFLQTYTTFFFIFQVDKTLNSSIIHVITSRLAGNKSKNHLCETRLIP